MEYARLGRSGLRVSRIGLGTNAFGARADARAARLVLEQAIASGVTLIDTANIYARTQSEAIIGEVLAASGLRHQVILATKAGLGRGEGLVDRGGSRWHLLRELEGSLRRLRTDYIDLYQIHTYDPNTPLEETLATLDAAVRAGKVRYIGCSNYAAWELARALEVSRAHHWEPYISVQPGYSLVDRGVERELVPLCLDQGIGILAYYPLAGGILTGKYRPGEPPPPDSRAATEPTFARRLDRDRLQTARAVAEEAQALGVTPAQLALAWLLHRPGVTSAIVGATRPEQLRENLGALEVPWTETVAQRLDALSERFVWAPPFAEYRIDREA
ncbi:MAG: aldo/keto reductase [Firmicutes bacterium]|nr:aldo/keto reductase [Alicyclobacillaceae bacterium]MCL6497671.1 aldo/keto reductase [Bacillota bacterium]